MAWLISVSCVVIVLLSLCSVTQTSLNLEILEDPDGMVQYAAFHQGLHCLLRKRQPLGPYNFSFGELCLSSFHLFCNVAFQTEVIIY